MPIVVGMAFYNNVLIPTGLVLLAVVAAVPLVRWGAGPARERARLLLIAAAAGVVAAIVAFRLDVRQPVGLAVAGLGTGCCRDPTRSVHHAELMSTLIRRRELCGFLIHLGFGCMAVGIAGSSIGNRETDLSMTRGQSVQWAGRTIRYDELLQRDLEQKVVVQARLQITEPNGTHYELLPAQNLYRPQNQWGTKVAIRSTFAGDFYAVLHGGSEAKKIHLTLIDHPLIRWLWLGGWVALAGVAVAAWPQRAWREFLRRARIAPNGRSASTCPGVHARSGRTGSTSEEYDTSEAAHCCHRTPPRDEAIRPPARAGRRRGAARGGREHRAHRRQRGWQDDAAADNGRADSSR